MLSYALLFCIGAVLASTAPTEDPQAEKRCVASQWEGVMLGKIALASDKPGLNVYPVAMNVSYDYKNKMESFREHIFISENQRLAVNIYRDWTKLAEYVEYPDKKECKSKKLPLSGMRQLCNDTEDLLTSFTLGDKMAEMYTSDRDGAKTLMTVLKDDMIPVSMVIEQNFNGVQQMLTLQYGNITEGIKDPKVFEIPEYCTKVTSPVDNITLP